MYFGIARKTLIVKAFRGTARTLFWWVFLAFLPKSKEKKIREMAVKCIFRHFHYFL